MVLEAKLETVAGVELVLGVALAEAQVSRRGRARADARGWSCEVSVYLERGRGGVPAAVALSMTRCSIVWLSAASALLSRA